MTTKDAIDTLLKFRSLLDRLYHIKDLSQLRSEINQSLPRVRKIVYDTGTGRSMEIAPPPLVGGFIMKNVDPFSMIFNAPYGLQFEIWGICGDIIDSAIGVLKVDNMFYEKQISTPKDSLFVEASLQDVGTRVFVVHGRNDEIKEATARFLERINITPIILHEQPNKGNTIIEKFEEYSDVGFAIVLMTPDDVGGLSDGELKSRARQNVVFELGYFIGKLGRNRVIALLLGDVEIPTDINGVVYIGIDTAGFWKMALARELKAAGYEIDMNKAI